MAARARTAIRVTLLVTAGHTALRPLYCGLQYGHSFSRRCGTVRKQKYLALVTVMRHVLCEFSPALISRDRRVMVNKMIQAP
jgi:hypothetical protein